MLKQMTLGQLADALERKDQDADVSFDFVHFKPSGIASYRGFYEEIAIGYESKYPGPKVAEVLAMVRDAIGKEFTGWKGGEFVMSDDTPVWVAEPGETGDTAIVDVVDGRYGDVILKTAKQEP